ncbi:MAG: sigma-54-dependent transcriptional regulator [bacterium]
MKILVVDDSPSILKLVSMLLEKEGYEVLTFSDPLEAWEYTQGNWDEVGLAIVDLMMPEMDGMELLDRIKGLNPDIAVIMMTAHGSVKSAVEAMKKGASDYINKPFDGDELLVVVKNALEKQRLIAENKELHRELAGKYRFDNIIGKSSAMNKVYEILNKVIDINSNVLIQGESGTGKELIAKAIHYNGPRKDKPFVKVDCTTIPEGLLESELFGHEKGAFTGATKSKEGKFEAADGGTVFLDEISEIKTSLQAKLMRFTQERVFERVGSNKPIRVDIRIISATNRDLVKMIQEGTFREDLYYRLNVIPIYVPPLRERKEDIPILVDHFLKRFNKENGKDVRISPEIMDMLVSYSWPGNVRELENCIERLVVLCNGNEACTEHLSFNIQLSSRGAPGGESSPVGGKWLSLDDVERDHIIKTLRHTNWNQAEASRLLGLHRNTLAKKIKHYNISSGT